MPAPRTPTLDTFSSGTSGRFAPFSSAPLFRNRLRIIALDDGFISTLTKCRASILSAVSKGTCNPS